MGESGVRSGTLSCGGAGGQDGQQALSLQVEEMLLLHLEELLLDGDLLGRQLSRRKRQNIPHPSKCPDLKSSDSLAFQS